MTYIYIAKTDILCDANEFQKRYEAVPAKRKRKIDRLRFDDDKRLSLGAWQLLCHALNEKGITQDKIILCENENGKPYLAEYPNIFFNLSHSGDTVMCAVSDGEVGCDVEKTASVDMRIANRFFHESEAAAISELSDENERRQLFYRLWTLKESFMKTTGLGFALPLRDFCIRFENGDIKAVQQKFPDEKFYFKEFFLRDGYSYSVCARTEHFSDAILVAI